MTDQSLQESPSRDALPVIRAFVGVAALLVAVVIVSTVLTAVFERLGAIAADTAAAGGQSRGGQNARIILAAIYAALGAAVFGFGSLLVRKQSDAVDSLDDSELVTRSGVIGLILFVFVYLLLGAFEAPIASLVLDLNLIGPVTMGGLAVGYLQYRDLPLHIALPDTETVPTVLGVEAVAIIAGIAPVVLSHPARDTVFSSFVHPGVGLLDILRSVCIVGILGGAGWGLLYNAAIQSRLRSVTHPAYAVGAVTALLGIRTWAGPELQLLLGLGRRRASSSLVGSALVVVIIGISCGLVAAWLFARGLETLDNRIEREVTPLLAGGFVVVVIALAVSIASVSSGYGIGFVWGVASLSAVSAAGSIGYERTRSVWVPALAFGSYWLLVDSALTDLLAHVVG